MDGNVNQVYSVTEIGRFIKEMLEALPILRNISIRGEITNFVHHKAGHLYFDLKDENAVINCVLFSGNTRFLKFPPKNGMLVVARGRISSYEKGSRYQLIVSSLEQDGIGSLHIAFEQLKLKLKDEGLFDPSHKLPIPKIPVSVGVVTSPTGAAIRDILNVSGRRFPYAKIVLFPALVQGAGAPQSIIDGICYFNETSTVDVIIIGRGGGSIEDLWAFNDETLARVIYSSKIPIISAVGHEIDYTISDFVADLRAPTPTAAAELALPDNGDLIRRINNITDKIRSLLQSKCNLYRQNLAYLANSRTLASPYIMLDDKKMTVASCFDHIEKNMQLILTQKRAEFVRLTSSLEPLNPLSVVSRGYSAVYDENKALVTSVKQLSKGAKVNFMLSDGSVRAIVEEVFHE